MLPPVCSLAPIDPDGYFGFTNYHSPVVISSNDPAHPWPRSRSWATRARSGPTPTIGACSSTPSACLAIRPRSVCRRRRTSWTSIAIRSRSVLTASSSTCVSGSTCPAASPRTTAAWRCRSPTWRGIRRSPSPGARPTSRSRSSRPNGSWWVACSTTPAAHWARCLSDRRRSPGVRRAEHRRQRRETWARRSPRWPNRQATSSRALRLVAADGTTLAVVPIVIERTATHGEAATDESTDEFRSPVPWVDGAVAVELIVDGTVVDSLPIASEPPPAPTVEVQLRGDDGGVVILWSSLAWRIGGRSAEVRRAVGRRWWSLGPRRNRSP